LWVYQGTDIRMNIPDDAWNQAYLTRGRLYGGSPPPLPGLPPGSCILEIGCGDGKGLGPMLSRDWNVTAIDRAPVAVSLCRSLKGREHSGGLLVADAKTLPFRQASFDAVFCSHILGHLDRPGRIAAAAESTRVLRQGGLLFFREFSTGDMRAGSGVEVEPGTFLRNRGIMTHYFTEEEVCSLFYRLTPVDCTIQRWTIRIRGEDVRRSEIHACFRKTPPESP
jgi:ubiquinone/menaquinone biosynthesis C-methylase UbiE